MSDQRPPRVHELKTAAPYFDAIEREEKTFEVRRDDRGFQRGDMVVLLRLYPDAPWQIDTTAERLHFRIGYILTGGQFGIEPGYIVFQLEPTDV